MILHYAPATGLQLQEPQDFRNFKLVIAGGGTPALEGIRYIADDHALVAADLVPALAGEAATPAWSEGFAAMVKAAAKYGWIDEATGAIKAHIERI